MSETPKREILLESGTNEMEILEFYLGTQSFGINVHKLREIIPFDPARLTCLPESPPSLLGTLLVRGETVPTVDLNAHLKRTPPPETESERRMIVLICEFNHCINGFVVDGVNQIHRVSWQDVHPMSNFLEVHRPRFTGSINIEGRDILIVDLEHIISEIDPQMEMVYEDAVRATASQLGSLAERRGAKKLVIAEDSAIIRSGILQVLKASGYTQITSFVDGQECFDAIRGLHQKAAAAGVDLSNYLDLVITDIEMPKMDGLTLCRKVKEGLGLSNLVVIMFSSLLDEKMALKCDSVGADGYITKPQIPELVKLIDSFLLKD